MRKNIQKLTEAAVMLALLVALQAITKPMGQIVTGSCVNGILAITVLLVGMGSGIAVAIISPVCAFLLGIAPNLVTVLPIMAGNVCFVTLLRILSGKSLRRQVIALLAAAATKFGVLYLLVVKVICVFASGALLGKKLGSAVILAPPMLQKLPAMFTWPQLLTALLGGAAALCIVPVVRKVLKR